MAKKKTKKKLIKNGREIEKPWRKKQRNKLKMKLKQNV